MICCYVIQCHIVSCHVMLCHVMYYRYYYQSFYSLGKRPPEPPLPTRTPGQPRVSCDEYEHGSCRWYDEWNFEHMIEYERQKYSLV